MPTASRSLIIGGTEVSTTDWPSYAAAFAWTGIGGGGWGCGGALIHADIVLTAAHCQWVYRNHGAWIGADHINGGNATFWPTVELIIHPEYTDQLSVHNDIMLVKLNATATDVTALYDINTDPDILVEGEPIRVIGFGTTSEGGTVSPTLRQVDINYVSNNVCAATWPQLDPDLHLCAGTTEGGRDACDSDSGSPLFVMDAEEGILRVVGVVGDGIGCARAGLPSLNTRVNTYADWIHTTVCQVSSHPPVTCAKPSRWNIASLTTENVESSLPILDWLQTRLAAVIVLIGVAMMGFYGRQWNLRRRRHGYQTVSSNAVPVDAPLSV